MKKEYIILTILIIGLVAYLGLKKDNQVHYELPTIPQVDTTRIDRVEISKADRLVVLNKGENGWTVTDKKFSANPEDIEQMIGTLKAIKLSALVSEAKDLARYELDDTHAVKVKALAGKEAVRSFVIGKTAPSYNHTFIYLDDKDRTVYQANGNFKSQFDKEIADFRDKKVLEFDPAGVKKVTLEKQGQIVTLIKSQTPETTDQEKDEIKKNLIEKKPVPKESIWKKEDGSVTDQKTISDLLSSLSKLECQAFLDEDKAARLKEIQPSYKILLENDKTFILNLFNKNENQDVEGSCSYTPYAFTLTSYKAEDIVSYADKLLGIQQQDSTESGEE
ncbi:DUF4340 domain-containing protein [Desulfobacter postgatei]|jgi:hypothetical protein|uniref:DUF4340 domain-containing protein n=1 Tax=Desulfobacter postgatei TaxID=2293 RepID=UPI002A36C2EF|nr:DUF4340 domain-containing protein [Desulfobacter postgatei]MDX9962659.1 DUF4340 domain-containing protein [Desulfobacter postgatei]